MSSTKTLPAWAKWVAGLLLVAMAGIATLLAVKWPFTKDRIVAGIQKSTGSSAELGAYETHFFPAPGCTIENLSLRRGAGQPIVRAEKLTIQSSWLSVLSLRKRVGRIVAQGLQIHVPLPFPPAVNTGSSQGLGGTVIGDFVADGAVVDIASEGSPIRRFQVEELSLREVGEASRISYTTVLQLPDPPGRLTSSGIVGPISWDRRGSTSVAGKFELRGAELDKYKGVAGSVNSKGEFTGRLEDIRIAGEAVASNFEVNRTGHPVDLRANYRVGVNGLSGNAILEAVEASFLSTHLSASGSIQGENGKTVSLRFTSERARVEDLLLLFTRSNQPALTGPIQLHADVGLLPGDELFLRRLRLSGGCTIRDAQWTRSRTQNKVNSLSARARGDKEQVEDRAADRVDSVRTQLAGDVSLNGGVATLSDVRFGVPGATATGGGTYNLITKRINLQGKVSMAADVSEATSGFKSFLLKPFDALFRRNKKQGATLPVTIQGQYPRPKFHVGLK